MTLDELKATVSALGMSPVLAGFAHLEGEVARLTADLHQWAAECDRIKAEAGKALQEAADERERVRGVFEDRLRQSMGREAALKAERDALAADNARLVAEMGRLDSHPEVREAKRKKLEAQQAALLAQIAALTPPAVKYELPNSISVSDAGATVMNSADAPKGD
jgi:chromosome segregation ATPase